MKPSESLILPGAPPGGGVMLAVLAIALIPDSAGAAGLAGHLVELPSWAEVMRVLTLQDYNTRVVIIGTTLRGLAAGLVGTWGVCV